MFQQKAKPGMSCDLLKSAQNNITGNKPFLFEKLKC